MTFSIAQCALNVPIQPSERASDATSERRRHAALASAATPDHFDLQTSFVLSNFLFYLAATGTKRTLFTQTFPPGHKRERYLKGARGRRRLHHG